jgi:hypothetical protein
LSKSLEDMKCAILVHDAPVEKNAPLASVEAVF